MSTPATATGGLGTWTPLGAWRVASVAEAGSTGAAVSSPGFDAASWTEAPARATVAAALAGDAPGHGPSEAAGHDRPEHAPLGAPWWFRSTFRVAGGGRTHVRVHGVHPRADLWVDGERVLDARSLRGARAVASVDVTDLVSPGLNALALCVEPVGAPGDPPGPWAGTGAVPPGDALGPWGDVVVGRTGPVRCGPLRVRSAFDEEVGALRAHLTVSLDVRNDGPERLAVLVAGTLAGHGVALQFRRSVALRAGETATVRFGEPDGPASGRLTVEDPELWWPIGEGDQPRYHLTVLACAHGTLSDRAEASIGIRTIADATRPGGPRTLAVNGRPVRVLGARWWPGLLGRHDPARLAHQLALGAHAGVNALYLGAVPDGPELFDRCDALGLMILADPATGWAETDGLGTHPSLVAPETGREGSGPAAGPGSSTGSAQEPGRMPPGARVPRALDAAHASIPAGVPGPAARAATYEAARAHFEALAGGRGADLADPAEGGPRWSLAAPWPGVGGHLVDAGLGTTDAYWGARTALERLHVRYAPDAETVQVHWRGEGRTDPLTVVVRRWRADGSLAGDERHALASVAPGVPVDVAAADAPAGAGPAWFLELELSDAVRRRSRNVYRLRSIPGDLAAAECSHARVGAHARAERVGAVVTVTVRLHHDDPEGPPAELLRASVHRGEERVAPVFWDDNDVTLFRGQSVVLTATLAAATSRVDRLAVEVAGLGLPRPLLVPVDVQGRP